ncbi:MAG TPA: GNAT family N-acetyltransferase [Limnochordia bacterium]|nr:GNAT family N-acetyltransferase [Limnochordia bacterium]
MQFRKGTFSDVAEIMVIVAQGQEYLRRSGIPQWQDGYPSQELIETDIERGNSYVLVESGHVVATTALEFGGDPNYQIIHEGQWITSDPYGAIHRIAIDESHKGNGLATVMVEAMEETCRDRGVFSLRVDTHEKNQSMQRMLQKTGFRYCGVIYLADGAPRIAYEKVLR